MLNTQKIIPFLWFDDNAEEAVDFYLSIFGRSRIVRVSRYSDGGLGPAGSVMLIEFELEGQRFFAFNGGSAYRFSEAISMCVECETQQEIDALWAKLGDRGTEGRCGWLKDKFGLSWQIVPAALRNMLQDSHPATTERVMDAMFQMRKPDITALKQAYELR